MTSIPLASVCAFLRPRDALGVLEGAPYTSVDVCGLAGIVIDSIDWELEHQPDASLYLGGPSGEVCPAAEGWASRVLAMALCLAPGVQGLFGTAPQGVSLYFPQGDRVSAQHWTWTEYSAWTRMSGACPSTPAERLAAVLRYELERVR